MFEVPMTRSAGNELRRTIEYGERYGQLVEHLPEGRVGSGRPRIRARRVLVLAASLRRRHLPSGTPPPAVRVEPAGEPG